MMRKQILKIVTDILMTLTLLLLMAYSLVGETAHEWLGIGMFVLFIVHHILNRKWTQNLRKGKYTPYRILQTALVVLSLTSMLGSMISGIVLSRHAFSFLRISTGQSWARVLHMLSAYWGFTFMSVHLGLHWSMMMRMAKRVFKTPSTIRAWLVRIGGFLIAACGVYAFVQREIGSYMLLKNQFVFFDFNEPLSYVVVDYVTIMGLGVFVGYYLSEGLKRIGGKKGSAL